MINYVTSHGFRDGSFRSCPSISFFHYCSEAATAEGKSVMHVSLRADTRATRWNTACGRDPNFASAVVDLISAVSQHSVTIGDTAGDPHLFAAIAIRIGVYSGDVCLSWAGGEQ